MKHITKPLILSHFFFSAQLYSQWTIVSTGGTKDFNSISFNTGYGYSAGDSGLVRRSVDMGVSWSNIPLFTSLNLNAVFAVSASNVYVCGDQGIVFKTTNSGVNWVALTAPTPGLNYQAMDFINGTTGIITGDNRRYARTSNGGANWVTGQLNITVGANLHYKAVDMLDSMTTFIASTDTVMGSSYNSFIQRTTNNGATFTNVLTFSAGTSNPFVRIQFVNQNTGFAITSRGYCAKTTNGGNGWTYYLMNMLCESAYFVNEQTGYACGSSGGLKKTTNGGITWIWQNSPVTVTLSTITCTDTITGIASGVDGTIVRTNNGGTYTGINQVGTTIPQSYSLSQNYPNPFNPSTSISFDIPNASQVKLTLYSILGAEIKVLANEFISPGRYRVSLDAGALPSGTYFYRLETGSFTETKKMILIK